MVRRVFLPPSEQKTSIPEPGGPGGKLPDRILWVNPRRPGHLQFEEDARKLWPAGREFVTPDEFVKILTNIPAEFRDKYGSDYQTDIVRKLIPTGKVAEGESLYDEIKEHNPNLTITEEVLRQLFWLVIPKEGEAAKMPQDSFTRALAALYRPKRPSADEAKGLKTLPRSTPDYRFKYDHENCTLLNNDPEFAGAAIQSAYKALYKSGLPYYGDISRDQADEVLHREADEYIKSPSKKPLGFILRFADSELDENLQPWGINIETCLMYPATVFKSRDGDKSKYINSVVKWGEHGDKAALFVHSVNCYTRFAPSDNLQRLGDQVKEAYWPQFEKTIKYFNKTVYKEWKAFTGSGPETLPIVLRVALEQGCLDQLIEKITLKEVFIIAIETPLAIEAMQHSNIRAAVDRKDVSIYTIAQLSASDIDELKYLSPDKIKGRIAEILPPRSLKTKKDDPPPKQDTLPTPSFEVSTDDSSKAKEQKKAAPGSPINAAGDAKKIFIAKVKAQLGEHYTAAKFAEFVKFLETNSYGEALRKICEMDPVHSDTQIKVIELLLSQVKVDDRSFENGPTALCNAAERRNEAVCTFLILNGANIDALLFGVKISEIWPDLISIKNSLGYGS